MARLTDVVAPPPFSQTASYTPGKWEFREIYPYDDGLGYISADGHYIIHAGVGDLPAEENRANGRLIAAAKELLEALTACQRTLAMIVDPQAAKYSSALHAYAQAVEAETKARAAIAAAKGGSQ